METEGRCLPCQQLAKLAEQRRLSLQVEFQRQLAYREEEARAINLGLSPQYVYDMRISRRREGGEAGVTTFIALQWQYRETGLYSRYCTSNTVRYGRPWLARYYSKLVLVITIHVLWKKRPAHGSIVLASHHTVQVFRILLRNHDILYSTASHQIRSRIPSTILRLLLITLHDPYPILVPQ